MVFFHTLFLADDVHAAKKIVNLIISFLQDLLITRLKLTSAVPVVFKPIIENQISVLCCSS